DPLPGSPHPLRGPHRARRRLRLLHVGADRPRRPDQRHRAARRAGRCGRAGPPRLRPRQAAPRPVRPLAFEGRGRRPRPLARHRPPGLGRSPQRHRQHADARHLRLRPRLRPRLHPGRPRRHLPRLGDRPRRHRPRRRRRLGAPLLAGDGDGRHLLRAAQLAAGDGRRPRRLLRLGLGLGPHQTPGPADHHPLRHPDGHRHAHRARHRRRDHEPGIHHRAARQGADAARHLSPRRQECSTQCARGDGPAARLPDGRLHPGRDRLLLAGNGPVAEQRHLPARPAGAPGHDPGAGDVLRRPQPAGRLGPDRPRPPHQARL
ncbi:MAG: ABC transporter, permease protein 1 (cluster 5, nickel/peptides/opines), partial [uncultured Craurococcus sp.]